MKRWPVAVASLVVGASTGFFLAGTFLQGQVAPAPAAPPVYPREISSYRDVVKKVLPAVVSIRSRAAGGRATPRFPLDGLDDDKDSNPSLGFGSGFLVDAKGVVLTNHHVVEGADSVEVTLKDGRKFTSRDVKSDPKTDLAIVRLDAKESLPYLELGDSEAMEIGDRVLAVGAPFGLTGSVTHGIISAKRHDLNMNVYEDFLQTDAAINPGNSGGPLVNLEGKVVGINSAIKTRGGGFQGVGLAISSNLARNIMNSLLKDGLVRRGYLGIQIGNVTDPDVAAKLGVEGKTGVLVRTVFEGSPSEKAGVKENDYIMTIGGKPVRDGRELQLIVASLPVGKPVDVAIVREGKETTIKVTIEEQPASFGLRSGTAPSRPQPRRSPNRIRLEKVGLDVGDLTAEVAERLGYKDTAAGALIVRVERGGVAASAGIEAGNLITHVDRQAVKTAEAVREQMATVSLAKGVRLQMLTPDGEKPVVTLRVSAD